MIKELEVAGKLYKFQKAMKNLFKDEYEAKIKPYKNLIKAHQVKFNLDVLPSVLELCSLESVRNNEMATILFMAAAVELIENP